jgi:hypothetical protein
MARATDRAKGLDDDRRTVPKMKMIDSQARKRGTDTRRNMYLHIK